MKRMTNNAVMLAVLFAMGFGAVATAQAGVAIATAPVGDAGNVADLSSTYGAVSYTYRIGNYDVTASQYTAFLNAVAKTDTYGLYNANMASASAGCGISQTGTYGNYNYAITKNGDFPVNYVSWGDAARFCNWLQNGEPTTGVEDATTTETGSYTLNGANNDTALMAISRNAGATYVVPTQDEWFKASYYKGGGLSAGYWQYPTKSDSVPSSALSTTGTNNANFNYSDPTNDLTPVGYFAGSPSPYGTFDQGGDLWQWTELTWSGNTQRALFGGAFTTPSYALSKDYHTQNPPTAETSNFGFRVASVPEPGSIAVLLAGALAFGIWSLRQRGQRV